MVTRAIVFFLFTVLFSNTCLAQADTFIVSGKVLLKQGDQPAGFIPIILKSGSLSRQTTSDKEGVFVFEHIPPGDYSLSYYTVSDSGIIKTFTINNGLKNYDAGVSYIHSLSKDLEEVLVKGKKELLMAGIDRKVYYVGEDLMSSSGSASEVLKNVPSVEVDIDGQVSLRGSSSVLVLINGKVSPLMGKTKAEVLQSMPANTIEKIEVMTNPSARYRPDGTSGIINIVLKKNVKQGFNGSLTANAGDYMRFNKSAVLNYHPGKLNLSGNYSYRKDYRRRNSTLERIYFDPSMNITGYDRQRNTTEVFPESHFGNAGFEYEMNDKISFGVSGEYFYRDLNLHNLSQRTHYDHAEVLTEQFDRIRLNPEYEQNRSAAVRFKYGFDEEDHEIDIEWNISSADEAEDNRYTNNYFLPDPDTSYDKLWLGVLEKENQLTIDYTRPVSENAKLEAGYDGVFQEIEQDFRGEYFDKSENVFFSDSAKSNLFKFLGAIHALYGTYETTIGKFGFNIGLRGEWTKLEGNQLTAKLLNANDYFYLFPTLHLAYKLDENNELQLNYSKRINRPDGDELNPFPEYQDPQNLYAGNPNLLPEIIHSFEFGYKWQHGQVSLVPGIYYRYTKNLFTEVTRPLNDTVFITTIENLSNSQSAGLELILTWKAGKYFRGSLTSNIFYNTINAANLGYDNSSSVFSMTANGVASLSLLKNTMLQLSGNYRSARLTPQGKYDPAFVLNAGIRQDLFHRKVSLLLTVSDIFSSNKFASILKDYQFEQHAESRRDGLVFYFGFSYRFGVFKAVKEEKLLFDNTL
jgi:outer membrane receptor protein involved in Fe transport